jgi:hypothetical protein
MIPIAQAGEATRSTNHKKGGTAMEKIEFDQVVRDEGELESLLDRIKSARQTRRDRPMRQPT